MLLSKCCCGCSLKTGTLIIMWLDFLFRIDEIRMLVTTDPSGIRTMYLNNASLAWCCIELVFIICGLVGVKNHRPSYLLPYIGSYVLSLVGSALATVVLWIGFLTTRDKVFYEICGVYEYILYYGPEEIPSLDKANKELIYSITFVLLIYIAITYYFFSVVYSYYKQMQEEDKYSYNPPAGTGVVYADPADQTKIYHSSPAYGQGATTPRPQQNVGHPPQPVAVYPQLPQRVGYP